MFTAKKLMFLYAVTPVHMGAGTALGVIDNPIQREVHTGHPVFAGSGIKGALRHEAEGLKDPEGKPKINVKAVFGPETNASEHAGAASFADAQLVAFPVRSLREGYVYATSPGALARLGRLAVIARARDFPADGLPGPSDTQAVVLADNLLAQNRLILESYAFDSLTDNGGLKEVARWLAANALPDGDGHTFFRNKLEKHLVLLSDTQLAFFVRNSTLVEPHVRIDDVSGTADDGGLFFTENLPPESLMVSLAMASQERRRKGDIGDGKETAEVILKSLTDTFSGRPVQIGGDATTGRGQVIVNFVGGGDAHA
ncbi:MAG: type III-B CRISPR module RAMP protein Cmr4 [Pseudomonadota bacterium]|jgi:CRISPR-associated protein Cmr4